MVLCARMADSEADILASRLARMKTMVDSLERACSESQEQHELFRKLKQEMDAARADLKTVLPSRNSS
jgi:hypothetical protein